MSFISPLYLVNSRGGAHLQGTCRIQVGLTKTKNRDGGWLWVWIRWTTFDGYRWRWRKRVNYFHGCCIAILKGSHACKPSKIILASQSLQKTICFPRNNSIREIVQLRREEADGCDNEIRLGVNIWAKDKETRDLRPENAVLRRRIDFSLGWAPGGSRETSTATSG